MSESRAICRDCSRPPGGFHSLDCPKRITEEARRMSANLFKMRQRMGARRFDQWAARERIRIAVEAREAQRREEIGARVEIIMDERQGKASEAVA